eukprot:TRINITY_DN9587_c0_g1_i1.p2 TRINITY_DN9587_c0_g1~~TRINITY_DN9587_c0_g1_i1.p2  ORF type:complete len:325 (+),score=58.01 TRINITY_DN9587_c0_g1_i1:3401-4375(+)
MKITLWFPLILLVIQGTAQTKVILDTDIDSDVDDVQALAMLHAYQQLGKVDLIGVIVTSSDNFSYQCADAINTFYNRPDIPIGFLKQQENLSNFSKYTKQVSEEFPHAITTMNQTTEADELYRKLLSTSEDNSVVIITIGHLTSLQNLLKSEADNISPFNGKELVNKKVKKWLCMGGTYPNGLEANFHRPDPVSTVYCLNNWEKEAIFCGWELGNEIITGGDYLKSNLDTSNPIYRAYELYNNFSGRPAWDQAAVMLLDKETATQFFNLNTDGYVSVKKDGGNQWHSGESEKGKNHAYISIKENIDPESIATTMDDLVLELESK